jgi:hypothetical protein
VDDKNPYFPIVFDSVWPQSLFTNALDLVLLGPYQWRRCLLKSGVLHRLAFALLLKEKADHPSMLYGSMAASPIYDDLPNELKSWLHSGTVEDFTSGSGRAAFDC